MDADRIDISERTEFMFDGELLKQDRCLDEQRKIYLYKRFNRFGRLYAYELVKGVKHTNPDGQVVYLYPSTSQFGKYGYFIARKKLEKALVRWVPKLQEEKGPKNPS